MPILLVGVQPGESGRVAELVLQGEEVGLGLGALTPHDEPGDLDFGAVGLAPDVGAGGDVGELRAQVGHEVRARVNAHGAVFALHDFPVAGLRKRGRVLFYGHL